jgi:hypothetical protein
MCGPGSLVGIATGYGLDGPGTHPGRARFSAPFETGPVAHPTSCKVDTGSFPGVKRLGRDADCSPLIVTRSKNRVELYLYSP